MKQENLSQEWQTKYRSRKVYTNPHVYVPLDEKYSLKKEHVMLIENRVDKLYNEISKKYSINESEVYDRLYMKVRKLFLEMM